ncbi:MAG TPA: hypothetical protein VJ742_07270, partial [Nitrososphaera sp.]|nr:hypothetical protein [Nitrososphaera sp.]
FRDGIHPQMRFVEAMFPDEAVKGESFAERVGRLEKRQEDIRKMMYRFCVSRLVRGDFSDWTGWEFRNEWAISSYQPSITGKRWRLEKVSSLSVLGEQGIGDEVMYASCLNDIQCPVVVECDPRIRSVLERAGYKTRSRSDVVDRNANKYLTTERPEEKFIPIGDLPRLFRKSLGDFPKRPYLTPLPEFVEKWSHLKGRTGVAWRSRTGQVKPRDLGIENPVSLQYDSWDYETEGMEVPGCDLRNDIEDLLGICANLERVVSVPQTIVHLAGSIGTKVDVVMPPVGSSRVENQIPWRYIDPMPWYSDARVYANLGLYRRSRRKS